MKRNYHPPAPPTPLETPCREAATAKTNHGYSRLRREGRQWSLHRWVWTLMNGPIPDGLCVLHRCDNRSCFRLDHLFLGTVADNNRDKAEKGRAWRLGRRDLAELTHCLRGHEFTPENTYVYQNKSGTHRGCKACGRERSLAWYHANKGAAA